MCPGTPAEGRPAAAGLRCHTPEIVRQAGPLLLAQCCTASAIEVVGVQQVASHHLNQPRLQARAAPSGFWEWRWERSGHRRTGTHNTQKPLQHTRCWESNDKLQCILTAASGTPGEAAPNKDGHCPHL